MSEKTEERLLDLLTDQALFGLSAEETQELEALKKLFPDFKVDGSLELTAGAIGLNNLESIEPMPAHLRSKILADAENFFGNVQEKTPANVLDFQARPQDKISPEAPARIIEFQPQRKTLNWLGWAVAAAACLALAINVWFTRNQPPIIVGAPPQSTPQVLSPSEQLAQLVKESDVIKAAWTDADPKKPAGITGEVVWSDKEQKGFLRLRGIPKNDVAKLTYQLWIFDANQSDKTPVDGGIFDVSQDGEVLIPINAKLKVVKPALFAVTAEKPGGVVVSDRKNMVTVAKVQT